MVACAWFSVIMRKLQRDTSPSSFAKPSSRAAKYEGQHNSWIFSFLACSWTRKGDTCNSVIDHPNPREFYINTGETKINFPEAVAAGNTHVGLFQRDGRERDAVAFFKLLYCTVSRAIYLCVSNSFYIYPTAFEIHFSVEKNHVYLQSFFWQVQEPGLRHIFLFCPVCRAFWGKLSLPTCHA